MSHLLPIRSALFVPGNRPERVDKAVASGADAVIVDLEDAVPSGLKEATRPVVRDRILAHPGRMILVRVNGLESGGAEADLEAVVCQGLFGIVLPKVDDGAPIHEVQALLTRLEARRSLRPGTVKIIPLIESAMAIENAYRIAAEKTEPERTLTLAFGAADYALDVGMEITKTGEELWYPRSRLVVACRAAGVDGPLDTPFMVDLKDVQAFEADARRAKQLGFQGKLCIHPSQVAFCNRLFSPTEEEVAFARRVVEAFEAREAGGSAAFEVDGKFVDYAVVKRARRVVRMGEKILANNSRY